MVKSRIRIPQSKYNPVLIQLESMRVHYPHFHHYYNTDGNLCFTGTVQPSLTMPVYKICVEYRADGMPRVRVIEPKLVSDPPHYHFSIDCLCLYKPENFNWKATKPISNYIISWATAWLYFYEVWKEKKTWYGPEADHNVGTTK